MMIPTYKILDAGDTAIVVEFGDRIDRRISAWVNALDQRLADAPLHGIVEQVPTFRSLMIHFEPLILGRATLIRYIDEILQELPPGVDGGRRWLLPICYEPEMAPDLPYVAEQAGISIAEAIERHISTGYHIYMLGFLPGQAYMGNNPDGLVLPRRQEPRLTIPAGTLAIALAMTSIFPQETPCGWHLIGRCPIPMWDYQTHAAPLLKAGDQVRFKPISMREFQSLRARFASGPLDLRPEGLAAGAAA